MISPSSPPSPKAEGLYPGADVEDTTEALFAEQGRCRPVIFWLVILLVMGALASLPFAKIDLTVRARGVVALAEWTLDDSPMDGDAARGIAVAAFVQERDAKFLRLGQSAILHYDAYPYTEWGGGSGSVAAISAEPVMVGQRTLFKVVIRSDTSVLRLADGRTGRITDGMAADVRLVVNRKSLLQVIYQKSEDLLGLG